MYLHRLKISLIVLLSSFLGSLSIAADLYKVTLLRAAPGTFESLIKEVKSQKKTQKGELIIMRHSQGDQWDLMLLQPAGELATVETDYRQLADYQHSFLAKSDSPWSSLKKRTAVSGLFHIEMFKAMHSKAAALLEERRMENAYLAATQQVTNAIFETTFGSDVDSFTIGFHKDLASFASSPDLPSEVFEQAAKDAGFKNRADLSFYLRSLILSHHDTLASRVD